MQQYFAKNKNLELDTGDYHHIKNVMRMKKDDIIKVVYDKTVYTCKLTSVSNVVTFDIIDECKKDDNGIKIDIAFSLIKEQKLNYLLQKATELGVCNLIPLNTIRSVVKIDTKKEENKVRRWQKICKEASEQSFRISVPKVHNIKNINDLDGNYDLKLMCSLNKSSKIIKKVLQNNNKYDKILLVFGPEGGFDPKEEELLLNKGFKSISLGSNVLRSETAIVAALSMINYEFMR